METGKRPKIQPKWAKNRIEVLEYLEYMGHDVKHAGHGQYRLVEHDSLVITPSKNAFYWFSRNLGGSVFQLMEHLDGIQTHEERVQLAREIRASRSAEFKPRQLSLDDDEEPFNLSNFSFDKDISESIDYLTDQRKIAPALVEILRTADLIRQTSYKSDKGTVKNIWFPWFDRYQQIIGADVIGIKAFGKGKRDGHFHGIAKGSPSAKASFHFNIGPNLNMMPSKLFVFEAPIDAISYWQMNLERFQHENVAFVAVSGVKAHTLAYYLQEFYTEDGYVALPHEIHFAVDNDQAGRDYANRMIRLLEVADSFSNVTLYLDTPTDLYQKDWNDVLRFGKWGVRQTLVEDMDQVPLYMEQQKD